MAETARVERARANPNGFQGRGRHQSAGVSKGRKARDSNPPSARHAVHRFQRCPSTSRSPSRCGGGRSRTAKAFARPASHVVPSPRRLAPPWSGWPDSNRRPPRPERGALTKLRYNPLVGTTGLEPATSRPPAARATNLRRVPMRTPETSRTSDLLVRSQALYPLSYRGMVPPRGVEPRTSALSERRPYRAGHDGMERRVRGSNPRGCYPVDGLASRSLPTR